MTETMLWLPIAVPAVAGVLALLLRKNAPLRDGVAILGVAVNLAAAIYLFCAPDVKLHHSWGIAGVDFALRLYGFSKFLTLAIAGFAAAVTLYCWRWLAGKSYAAQFYCYMLISVSASQGAVLADHLITLLFFWEGLLAAMFGAIAVGRPGAWKTATKAFIIVGVTDLCLMAGMILTGVLAGTMTMSQFPAHGIEITGLGGLGMVLMLIGATSKAGSMPFHTWIPDAAVDSPLPFMAILPASLEKLLGIYLLARITLDLYHLTVGSWVSMLLMIVGAATILLAVMMALVQTDYKRLLSYHAISQVGYMILGVGTAVPIGIVGGIFHMINHAMYKSCLFLTGGAVERQAGTTDLEKLGGLARKMPITFACFLVAACSISGMWPFNGFFSKELVYDAARQQGWVFYAAAILGTFFTAASFLKLGHAAYWGKRSQTSELAKEAPLSMLVPMIFIAGMCCLFGLYNELPLRNLIVPIVGEEALHGHHICGIVPANWFLTGMTAVALLGAILNHAIGVWRSGSGIGAADHIHYAPILENIYDRAARRQFDPYDIGRWIGQGLARVLWWADRGTDWLYDGLAVGVTGVLTRGVRLAHTGSYAMYVVWALVGGALVIWYLVGA